MNAAQACTDQAVIGQRIIDCFLREDIRGLVSQGRLGPLPTALAAHALAQPCDTWLQVSHLDIGELWLPVRRGAALQAWSAVGDAWLREQAGQVRHERGHAAWLALMSQGLDDESLALFRAYGEEADCAVSHRTLCRQARAEQGTHPAALLDAPTWDARLLEIDRLASYLDHPFYPTARAKSGFDQDALQRYAPEFAPRLQLNWLAVPQGDLALTCAPPAHWPSFAEVGLAPALAHTHALLPVHPMTWPELERHGLPDGAVRAPAPALWVQPTLSVRTVACVDQPRWHIKLPLLVRTLGARNLRLIKPSTLYDGHAFQCILQALAERDPALAGRYRHVDELHGGHVGEHKHLAYIVRHYPEGLEQTTLVPVAALASPLEDGRLFVQALAERFHGGDLLAWLDQYLDLLLQVHLRLWLRYGIALEANQQNAVLMFQAGQPLRLLMKDNDAARLWPHRFLATCPDLAERCQGLRDERIRVERFEPLAEMFTTITLQLNIVAPLEAIAEAGLAPRQALYQRLRERLHACLEQLEGEGLDCGEARRFLLDSPYLPVKYLLSAGSLFSKAWSGAQDINKFYGYSARNFLLEGPACPDA